MQAPVMHLPFCSFIDVRADVKVYKTSRASSLAHIHHRHLGRMQGPPVYSGCTEYQGRRLCLSRQPNILTCRNSGAW